MPKVTYTQPDGEAIDVDVPVGTSIMDAARKNGVEGIVAECGGACSCATCHVYVAESWLGKIDPMSDTEDSMLEFAEDRRPNSRLSCQIIMREDLDGIAVEVAEEN